MRLTAGSKIFFLLVLLLILFSSQISDYFSQGSFGSVQVTGVIDGDTLEIDTGQRVRLLGIDAPEIGQPFHEEASLALASLVRGKNLRLESDAENKDKYGRLLRYVFVDDVLVNAELVRKGYARAYLQTGLKYSDIVKGAEEEAKSSFLGIWYK